MYHLIGICAITLLLGCNPSASVGSKSKDTVLVLHDTVATIKDSTVNLKTNDIEKPANGNYLFAIAYAEWNGMTQDSAVLVHVEGDRVVVLCALEHGLTNSKKGDTLDQGILMKHKSGNWIIGKSSKDKFTDEYGGCSGGPAIIDFIHKKYWLC